jgi:hypothetical protein
MTGDDLNREMIDLRRRFSALEQRLAGGELSELYPEARELTDVVICLLDEAPEQKRGAINRLADRCEALLRSLAN